METSLLQKKAGFFVTKGRFIRLTGRKEGEEMTREQLEQLYRAHYRMVFSYALSLSRDRSVAEDLTQEAFLRYFKTARRFRGECAETTRLCQAVKSLWIDRLRKEGRLVPLEEQGADEDLLERLEDEDQALRVHRALHTLPEPYKEVFSLRVFGELPFAKIAHIFGRTESWARVTYSRARQKLREQLEQEETK